MKTLNTIQKLSNAGRILSKIVFIFCLVGAIFCAVGLTFQSLLPESFKLGSVTIHGIVETSEDLSQGTSYAVLTAGLILCVGEAVLSGLAGRYFKNELAARTPFTFAGAKELIRLGVCAICIPLGTKLIADVAYQIFANLMPNVAEMELDGTLSVGLGIMMIVAGLLCRHGAEISQGEAPVLKD